MFGIDPRAARVAWTVFLVALLLGAVYLARQTLFLVVLAVFFAYLVDPAVRFLERRFPRVSHTIAVSFVFVAVLALLGTVGTLIGQQVTDQAVALSERLPALLKDPHATDRIPLPQWMEPLRERIVQMVRGQFAGGGDNAVPFAQRVGRGVVVFAGNLVYLVIIPILSFLLIKDADRLHEAAMSMLGTGPRRTRWEVIIKELNTVFARYIRALLLLAIAVFCVYGLVLSLLDVPYALVIAGIAAPLEFIPFVGPLAAAVIALLIAGFSGYDHLAWIAGFILAYRLFQDYALSPYFMSEGVEVHPVLVIVGLLAGEEIAGVAGMFLAIPLVAAMKVVLNAHRATAAPPDARFTAAVSSQP